MRLTNQMTIWNSMLSNVKQLAAAKSLQSCPTLCNPRDGSPPGSPVPGILQARPGVGCHCLLQCMKVKSGSEVVQSCPTPSDPMDCSLPGSSVHGICQATVLEWGAIAFSNVSMLLSQFVPPSPPRTVSTNLFSMSASTLLPCK